MPPNSYDVSLPKSPKKNGQNYDVAVIDLPKRSIENEDRVVSYEVALKEIGFGKVQIQLIFVIALILMQSLNETMGISFVVPAAKCDLDLSTGMKGLLTGMTFIGILVASYFWGFLGDTQGRKRIIIISMALSTTFSLISVFLKSFTLYLICRFVIGVFVAGFSATVYAYVGEFNSNKNRTAIISWVSASVGLALTFQPLMALWILSYDWRFELYDGYEFRPWRLLLITYTIPGIIGGLCLLRFPESPKFLLSVNRDEEALQIVRWIYRTNKGEKNHDNMKFGKLESEASEASKKDDKGLKAFMKLVANQTFPLFKPPYLIYFLSCSFLHLGTFSIAGGMASFMPDIFNRLAKVADENGPTKICDSLRISNEPSQTSNETVVNEICDDFVDPSVYTDTALIGCALFVAFIILSSSVKKLGRRIIFIATLLTSGASGILLTFVTPRYLIVVFYTLFIVCTGLNVSVINGAAVDIFPTHLRSMAVTVSMMFGRLGTALSTNLIGYLLERNCEATYYSFSGMVLVCLVVSFIIPGKTSH